MKISLIGEKIKRLREDANLSQIEVAEYAGIGSDYLSRLESGKKPNVGIIPAAYIAHRLGVTVDDLLKKEA